MKFITLLLLPLLFVFLTLAVMAKLLSPNPIGLSDSEIEAIWLERNSISIDFQYYTPPMSRIIYCGGRVPPPPHTFLADLPKQEPLMYSPVNTQNLLCNIEKEFCNTGI